MSNVIYNPTDSVTKAEERLLRVRALLGPREILDRNELLAFTEWMHKIWNECPPKFMEAAESTAVQRALIHAEIRRDIDRLAREVEKAVKKYRRKAHRGQRDLLRSLNLQIDQHRGSSALKDACRKVLQDPPGFDAELTALDITIHTEMAAKSCQALLHLMDCILWHPPRCRSSTMNLQTPVVDHSLAKAERREVLVDVPDNHSGSHDAYVTKRTAKRYRWR